MTAPSNFIHFCNQIIHVYRNTEDKIGLADLQNNIPKPLTYLITGISFVAIGYFAYRNTNKILLGAGLMTGMCVSYIDPTFGRFSSLTKGALFPIDQKGSFAFQKIYFVAFLLGKHFGFPTGFFMGNALYHVINKNIFEK